MQHIKCAVQNNKLFWKIDYFDTEADVGGGSDSILGANGWLKMGMENPQWTRASVAECTSTAFVAQFLKYLCFQGIVCTPYPHQKYVVVLGQKNTTESIRRIKAGFMAQIEYILAQAGTTRRIQGEYQLFNNPSTLTYMSPASQHLLTQTQTRIQCQWGHTGQPAQVVSLHCWSASK